MGGLQGGVVPGGGRSGGQEEEGAWGRGKVVGEEASDFPQAETMGGGLRVVEVLVLVFFDGEDVRRAALRDEQLILPEDKGCEETGSLQALAFGAEVAVEQEGVEAFDERTYGGGGRAGGLVVGFGEAGQELVLEVGVEGGSAGEGEVEDELIGLTAACNGVAGGLARGRGQVEAGEGIGGVFSGTAVKWKEVKVGGH